MTLGAAIGYNGGMLYRVYEKQEIHAPPLSRSKVVSSFEFGVGETPVLARVHKIWRCMAIPPDIDGGHADGRTQFCSKPIER